jgi:hypothetical protein
LRNIVASKLILDWSPKQISGWLKTQYPDDESMRVSHETIYRSLFIQARGALKKELLEHLRSQRRIRRSRHSRIFKDGRGQIPEAISIRERPAEVEDRALDGGCCGRWSSDGKYYFYVIGRDVWVLSEQRSLFGKIEIGIPAQLTFGPITYGPLTPSVNGKELFVVGVQPRVGLVRYARDSKQFVPFLGGISAGELEVSPDGQWVTYTTFPESDLWRSKLDGTARLQLTFPPINAHEPRWSPDGKKILLLISRPRFL